MLLTNSHRLSTTNTLYVYIVRDILKLVQQILMRRQFTEVERSIHLKELPI